jgi:uncharacterized membrane protein YhaH (DUF805 family)
MVDRIGNKKEIRKDARQLFREGGKTKQEVYEILVEKYKYAKDVADVLRYVPSTLALKKYGKTNSLLLVLICLTTIAYFALKTTILIVILMAPPIYFIATLAIRRYYDVSFFSFLCLINLITYMGMKFDSPKYPWPMLLSALILNIAVCYLSFRLRRKMCPKPVERREEYTNAEGEQRIRLSYEFSDIGS